MVDLMSDVSYTSPAWENEPEPSGDGDPVLPYVLLDITKRAEMGVNKYGTLLRAKNGRDALNDLYQELLDSVMYLKQVLMELDSAEMDAE
jgi:hypothetical protein